ncbi:hypothetical protein CVT25_015231 [Psilocybe cyanescens]|uniref:Inositol-pentakisphosphate 2-kinase n=1 Tax=Psilocybe cyanescens TaxID=93625 RepID=A0A409XQZ2_PSICY|nr:hypothetical protein CVT25_015231 [Psilocybe cyanescens]
MANILQTEPNHWKYVSEGGATIVFSYCGPSHPDFDGTVLRLRKSIVTAVSSGKTKSQKDLDALTDGDEPDDPTIEYQVRCMERLIPQEYLPRLRTVMLDRSWLESLVQLQDSSRPEDRREKDEVDLDRKKGVLATDLVGGNWLAVEIKVMKPAGLNVQLKPKWAFLPSPRHLSEETKSVKTQTCRFCMQTHLRAHKGQQIVTNYCPLDLFSGDEGRIIKAICSLWDGWVASDATANNLKIFARGKFVTPSEAKLMLKNDACAGVELNAIRDAFAITLLRPLFQTPILHIISRLQRTLDVLDIEGLSKLWRETESSAPLYRTTFAPFFKQKDPASQSIPPSTPIGVSSLFLQAPEPDISDWINFLDNYLSPDKSKLDHSNPSPENLREYLMAYLLSATFKDCSIIIKLDFLDLLNPPEEDTSDSVTIIDLDPKSMKKLKSWEKLDQEIAITYATSTQQKKICIDQWQHSK